jgi:hypothetical protein
MPNVDGVAIAATRNWWRAPGKGTKKGEQRGTTRRRWLGTVEGEFA